MKGSWRIHPENNDAVLFEQAACLPVSSPLSCVSRTLRKVSTGAPTICLALEGFGGCPSVSVIQEFPRCCYSSICKYHRLTVKVTSDDRPRALLMAGGYTDAKRPKKPRTITVPRIPLRTVPQACVKVQPGLALAPPTTHTTLWILSTKHPRRELQACRTKQGLTPLHIMGDI